jgi:hypothetical protein
MPGKAKADQPSAPAADRAQASLEFDVVRMPLAEAGRLLRKTFRHADAAAELRAEVDKMLAGGTAERTDYTTFNIMDDESCNLEGVDDEPYSTAWQVDPLEHGGFSISTASIGMRHVGTIFDASVKIAPDNLSVSTSVTAQWAEICGSTAWRAGKQLVSEPAFTSSKFSRQSRLSSGNWSLQAVLPVFEVSEESQSAPAQAARDRLVILAKATVQTPHPPFPAAEKTPQCRVLCEWIGTDAATADALSAKFNGPNSGEAMREALDAEIAAGAAVLEDVAAVSVLSGTKGKQETVCDVPRPGKLDFFTQAAPNGASPGQVAIEFVKTRRAIEVEATRRSGNKGWRLKLSPTDGKSDVPEPPEKKEDEKKSEKKDEKKVEKKDEKKSEEQKRKEEEEKKKAEEEKKKKDEEKKKKDEEERKRRENEPPPPPTSEKCELQIQPDKTVLAAKLAKPLNSEGRDAPAGKRRVTLLFVKLFE